MKKSIYHASVEELMLDIVGCEIELTPDNTYKVSNGDYIAESTTRIAPAMAKMFVNQLRSQYNIEDPNDQQLIEERYQLDWMGYLRDYIPVKHNRVDCDEESCDCTGNCGNNYNCGC